MDIRSQGRLVMTVVILIVCALGLSPALAQPAGDEGALVGGRLSPEEKSRIATLPEAGLADLLRTGTRGQREAAVAALVARDRGEMLLSLAKAGPRPASEIVIELYVPKATMESNARAKRLVDAYLAWLEDQLVSESPVVRPEYAARSLARAIYWHPAENARTPGQPDPAPRYQHQRVVRDLIALLRDRRPVVADVAAGWLGSVGGYSTEQAREVTAALAAYKQAVGAQPVGSEEERARQRMRLAKVDQAIQDVIREQERRTKAAAVKPYVTTTPAAPASDK